MPSPREYAPSAIAAVWDSSPKRLIPADERSRPRAPQKIEADLEDVLGFLDVDWKPKGASKAGYWSADEVVRVGAKVVIVVLGEASDPVGECVFNADAERPTATSVAHRSDRTSGEEREGEVISLPRATALQLQPRLLFEQQLTKKLCQPHR